MRTIIIIAFSAIIGAAIGASIERQKSNEVLEDATWYCVRYLDATEALLDSIKNNTDWSTEKFQQNVIDTDTYYWYEVCREDFLVTLDELLSNPLSSSSPQLKVLS